MSYHLIYSNKAMSQFDRLPPEFVDAVEAQLLRLADTTHRNLGRHHLLHFFEG